MSGRTLLILFVVLVFVAAAALLVSRDAEAPEPVPTLPPTPERVQLLTDVTIEMLERIEVESPGREELAVFTREPEGGWSRTVPTQTAVISQTLNTAATGLLNLTSRRTLPEGENPLSAYGLAEPAWIIIAAVQREDGQTARYRFLVGNPTPTGDGYYLQKEGDPRVYIVPTFSIENLIALVETPPIAAPAPEP